MKKILILSLAILVVIISIIYINDNATTGRVVSDLNTKTIILPVKVHIISEPRGVYSSTRPEQNIIALLDKTNQIWSQAGIYFQLEEITSTEISFEAIPNAINGNFVELQSHQNFDEIGINLFLVQSLNGINGLTLKDINSILISDSTTVNDFRTTAHELGHLLE